jgi:hypothetical protein
VVSTHVAVYEGALNFDYEAHLTPCTTHAWSTLSFLVERTAPLLNGRSQCPRAMQFWLAARGAGAVHDSLHSVAPLSLRVARLS